MEPITITTITILYCSIQSRRQEKPCNTDNQDYSQMELLYDDAVFAEEEEGAAAACVSALSFFKAVVSQ